MDRPIIEVKVTIKPLWVRPSKSVSGQIAQEQAESRFTALAYQVAQWLEGALNEMSPEDMATASHTLRQKLMERWER